MKNKYVKHCLYVTLVGALVAPRPIPARPEPVENTGEYSSEEAGAADESSSWQETEAPAQTETQTETVIETETYVDAVAYAEEPDYEEPYEESLEDSFVDTAEASYIDVSDVPGGGTDSGVENPDPMPEEPDPTPVPTPTPVPDPTPTPVPTPTPTPTPVPSVTPTPSLTPTPTPVLSVTPTPAGGEEGPLTPTPEAELTPTPELVISLTPTPGPDLTPIPSITPEPSVYPTPVLSPVPSPAPSGTPTPSPEVTPTLDGTPTPTPEVTPTPDGTPTPSPEVTPTPDGTPTPSPEVTPTPDGTPTPTPEVTPTPEGTPTPTPEVTPTPDGTPTPTPEVTPTPEGTPTPTPEVTPTPDGTPTPTPEVTPTPDGTPTPTPEGTPTPSPTPTPAASEAAAAVIERISALDKIELSAEQKGEMEAIRALYDALTEEEKAQVTNYRIFEDAEKAMTLILLLADISDGASDLSALTLDNSTIVLEGTPVYYTNMISNLHAGKEFYLNSLQENYRLSFSDDFAEIMEDIERTYREANKLVEVSEMAALPINTSADNYLVRNWQDILAIYIYRHTMAGEDRFYLDGQAAGELYEIFEEMNPLVPDPADPSKVSYGERHINYYIKKNKINRDDREILKKYMETDCELLCAVVTGAKGFIRESVGEDVSEERVNVIAAAYSLIGKVGYFWGGKYNLIGENPEWGKAYQVTSAGSPTTGTIRALGLDCSGFVTWAVINGYQDAGMRGIVGEGTSQQWELANVVREEDAQPGDLVFQRGPEAGSDNHVGILCGKTANGDWIAVHCASSKNGVTVGEAYGASFRYIRQPDFYPTEEEIRIMRGEDIVSEELTAEGIRAVSADGTVYYADALELRGGVGFISSAEPKAAATGKEKASAILVDDSPVILFDTDVELFYVTVPAKNVQLDEETGTITVSLRAPENTTGTFYQTELIDDSQVELF